MSRHRNTPKTPCLTITMTRLRKWVKSLGLATEETCVFTISGVSRCLHDLNTCVRLSTEECRCSRTSDKGPKWQDSFVHCWDSSTFAYMECKTLHVNFATTLCSLLLDMILWSDAHWSVFTIIFMHFINNTLYILLWGISRLRQVTLSNGFGAIWNGNKAFLHTSVQLYICAIEIGFGVCVALHWLRKPIWHIYELSMVKGT